MQRTHDVEPIKGDKVNVYVDGSEVEAAQGETVLSVLFAIGKRDISLNDRGVISGAYCGMGVCHACTVRIDGMDKRRACQVVINDGMNIETQKNKYHVIGGLS